MPVSRRGATMILVAACAAVFSFLVLLRLLVPYRSDTPWHPVASSFNFSDWSDIVPSKTLHYAECYDGLQCARLRLPLSWKNDTGQSVDIAVLRVPASVPINSTQYGGSIFMNTGAPGFSCIDVLRRAPEYFKELVNSPEKQYDILTFDLRGVGHSLPKPSCFADRSWRDSWSLRLWRLEGQLGSSDAALGRLYAMHYADGAACSYVGWDAIERHMTTTHAARDLLELVEKHDDWLKEQIYDQTSDGSNTAASDRLRYSDHFSMERRKLNAWVFSYGTFLAGTFASMYPERVGRVILDGVPDFNDLSSGRWAMTGGATEKAVRYFYESCASAGPEYCPLAAHHDTADHIEASVGQTLRDLRRRPLPVTEDGLPEIITYSDLKNAIYWATYAPLDSFLDLAQVIHDIQSGNGTRLAHQLRELRSLGCGPTNALDEDAAFKEAQRVIVCTDGDSTFNESIEDVEQRWHTFDKEGPSGGAHAMELTIKCVGWTVRPEWRFKGPFGSNETSPMLFIGNTGDPVTPTENARNMAALFNGSRLLTMDGTGHVSIQAGSSPCIADNVKAYFGQGTLPIEGTVCPTDEQPFDVRIPPVMGLHDKSARTLKTGSGTIFKGAPLGLF